MSQFHNSHTLAPYLNLADIQEMVQDKIWIRILIMKIAECNQLEAIKICGISIRSYLSHINLCVEICVIC